MFRIILVIDAEGASQIVAVGQATNSGAVGRWRSPDRQLIPIEVRQLYIHHLQLIYLQWFVHTAFVAS